MKLGIIGSRGFDNYDMVCKELETIEEQILIVVSGGAKGADSLGERWGTERGKEILIFKPDWGKFGKRAGYIRNEDIVKNSDKIIAFWDGVSRGTKHSIELAQKLGKECKIIYF